PPWPPTAVAVTDVTQASTMNWCSPAEVYVQVTVPAPAVQPAGSAAGWPGSPARARPRLRRPATLPRSPRPPGAPGAIAVPRQGPVATCPALSPAGLATAY